MPPALDLARRYAEALTALRAVHLFDAWLGSHWHEHCPAPDDDPTSRTPLGAEGAIVWFEDEETVVGYVPGEAGCFRIPREAAMPAFPHLADAGGVTVHYGQDIVISAAMRDEGNGVLGW